MGRLRSPYDPSLLFVIFLPFLFLSLLYQSFVCTNKTHATMRRKEPKWPFWGQNAIFGLFAIFWTVRQPYRLAPS